MARWSRFLIVLLVVTLQGLLRMLGVMNIIGEQRLSTLDAGEELHRAAWDIEVALRHARIACADGASDAAAADRIGARPQQVRRRAPAARGGRAPASRDAAFQYEALADDALSTRTCPFLSLSSTEERRMELDEDMTDTWIDDSTSFMRTSKRKKRVREQSATEPQRTASSLPSAASSRPCWWRG